MLIKSTDLTEQQKAWVIFRTGGYDEQCRVSDINKALDEVSDE